MLDFFNKQTKETAGSGCEFMIVGLGNPGAKYEGTRHNSGFMAIDAIAEKYNTSISRIKFKGSIGSCKICGKQVLLLKPGTFMNLSGQSVTEAMRFYKLAPQNVLILLDDISLPPGKIRIRRKGSDGGQNGIKNIIYLSGSDEFPRIKIGIGAKPHPDYDLANWVLSKFSKQEEKELLYAIENTVTAAALIAEDKIDEAMGRFNGK